MHSEGGSDAMTRISANGLNDFQCMPVERGRSDQAVQQVDVQQGGGEQPPVLTASNEMIHLQRLRRPREG